MKHTIFQLNKIKQFLLLSIAMLIIISSCSYEEGYEKAYEPKGQLWTYEDVLLFEPTVIDTLQKFDIYLQIEHLKSYPFQNLYISFDQQSLSKNISNIDTLNINLINRSGYYTGDCKGDKCIANIQLYKEYQFKNTGKQLLKIKQLTRLDSLPGIQKIGLLVKNRPLD